MNIICNSRNRWCTAMLRYYVIFIIVCILSASEWIISRFMTLYKHILILTIIIMYTALCEYGSIKMLYFIIIINSTYTEDFETVESRHENETFRRVHLRRPHQRCIMVLRVLCLVELTGRHGNVLVESEAGEVVTVAVDVREHGDKERRLVLLWGQEPSRRLTELQHRITAVYVSYHHCCKKTKNVGWCFFDDRNHPDSWQNYNGKVLRCTNNCYHHCCNCKTMLLMRLSAFKRHLHHCSI